MRKFSKALIIMFLLIPLFPLKAKAETLIDINNLIEKAKELDGQEVTVQGEAIGEPMERGDYSWVNINDGTNAIGIWMKKSDADKITYYGDYKRIGDTVKITGIFYRACKEHGGEADLHCASLEIASNGYQVKEQVSTIKVISAMILVPITLLLLILFRRKSKAKRR